MPDSPRTLLESAGVPRDDARVVADVLSAADARGIEAHGTATLDALLARLRSGAIDPAPRGGRKTVRETPTSLVLDAAGGLGHPASREAMERTIGKASRAGTAFAAVRNSSDFGFAGYYAMMALERDMIGIAATNTARYALPTFGREVLLGTNPLAFAVPAATEPGFVLDFATTTVQDATLRARRAAGEPVPDAWSRGDALLPLGGHGTETGGHKGYGLALLIDLLCAVLAAGTLGADLSLGAADPYPAGVSHFFGAFRIDGFREPAAFKADMDALLREHKNSEKAPGYPRIYVAGEPEYETSRQRKEQMV
ncbi:MAG: Ldh family oxidoreductase [Candidatus Eremiobacteraeota bacterium]|nr:Ldh family oxidoreductase [Candidatus Eremiobacteraeota bacterium]